MSIRKVALIFPKGELDAGTITNIREPLGICSLSAYLKSVGYVTRVFQQTDEDDEAFIEEVIKYAPDVAGFSAITARFQHGIELARMLKDSYGDVPIVFGGDHVSGIVAEYRRGQYPDLLEQALHEPIDFMIPYEGEIALAGLVRSLEKRENRKDISGIVYRDKTGEIIIT